MPNSISERIQTIFKFSIIIQVCVCAHFLPMSFEHCRTAFFVLSLGSHIRRKYSFDFRRYDIARLCTCLCQSVGWFYDARQEVRTFLITCWSFCTLTYLAAVMLLTGKKQIHFLLIGVCLSCCFYFPHLWNTKCNFIDRHFLRLPSIWILCIKYSATHTCMISISFHFVVGNRCVGV